MPRHTIWSMFKGPGSRAIPTTGVHGDDRKEEREGTEVEPS
ncbi:hypothetical protein DBV15_06884 [Temnothorax longispinosus]|uniref:Uncharacterized protein n=1 Tax=Temnothorax longispinosus TaxID=300112 RepID=A0A4V3S628_9HYME|nr:hypothetical protein DBV15_06884 [Temnothorax longispinosus]